MPRRLHPTPRLSSSEVTGAQGSAKARPFQTKFTTSSKRKRTPQDDDSESSSEDISEADSEEQGLAEADVSSEEEQDIDAPRVAQWVDEDDLEKTDSEDEPDDSEVGQMNTEDLDSLQNDLASLPLGALRRAQRALARAQVESEPEDGTGSESEPDHESESELEVTTLKRADKPEWSNKPRKDISKRKNKHAPIEVTSKKPVTRRRQIIDVPKVDTRDPRFLPFVGQFKPESFRKQYDFLSDMHTTEMKSLREHLKRAKKLLVSSPRHLREEREQEVARLELTVKRAESFVNKDKREKIEQDALDNVKKEEREKRKTGKGAWYMKDSDKRKLLVRARYEALAAEGGKAAVKKAIEKKQKKVGQKEKKKRPFESGAELLRKRSRLGAQGSRKRRRVG